MWALFGRDFGYDLGEEIVTDKDFSFWRVYKGKKKATSESVSVFYWAITTPRTVEHMEIAKTGVKRLKTLRHPCLLTYLHSYEGYQSMYLATESVIPLNLALKQNNYTRSEKQFAISYGLHQVLSALKFLHADCDLSHNNVNSFSIFVNKAGEWKLFGLEFATSGNERPVAKDVLMQTVYLYDPPEADHPTKKRHKWSHDAWGFSCLIWEIFNGSIINSTKNKNTGMIPRALLPIYAECLNKDAMQRPSIAKILEQLTMPNQFLNNKYIDTMLYLREIHIKDNEDKVNFFNSLPDLLDAFPQDACLYRILPELVNAFEFGNAGSSVLPSIFKLGKLLTEDEYQEIVVPCIVKMFLSKDRNMRVKLLEKMNEFIDNFSPSIVNSQIYPNVAQGFLDTSPIIREHSIKCMLSLAPKLSSQNLNDDLLKHFARLQTKDEQGGIRTNTTVCLGKIASYLQPETRQKVLINAFIRALRDPFPAARTAAVLAFSATENYYNVKDIASKVLPALCYVTIDPDKGVRDQAFKSINGFLEKLSKLSDNPGLLPEYEKDLQSVSATATSSSWTSWAVSSLVDKLTLSKSPDRETKKPPINPIKQQEDEEEIKKLPARYPPSRDPRAEREEKRAQARKKREEKRARLSAKSPPERKTKEENADGWEAFDDIESNLPEKNDNSQIKGSHIPEDDAVVSSTSVKGTKIELMSKALANDDTSSGWDNDDGDWGTWGDTDFENVTTAKETPTKKQSSGKKD